MLWGKPCNIFHLGSIAPVPPASSFLPLQQSENSFTSMIYLAEEKASTCADISCPPAKICVLSATGQPTCKCLVECTRKLKTGPVCGMNGKEYPDLCDLKNDECVEGDYILVRKYGGCGPTSKIYPATLVLYHQVLFS